MFKRLFTVSFKTHATLKHGAKISVMSKSLFQTLTKTFIKTITISYKAFRMFDKKNGRLVLYSVCL